MPGQNGRRSVLDEVGDIKAPKGSRAWCIAILGETRNTIGMLHADATTAGRRLRALKDVEAWKALGLISWSVLLMQIGLSDDEADGLIGAKKGQSVGVILRQHGGDRKTDKVKDQGNNVTLNQRGNDKSYTLARLRRDEPELAKRVEAGELSANAAAIKAGFRYPTMNVRIDSPEAAIRGLLRRFTKAQIKQALEEALDR